MFARQKQVVEAYERVQDFLAAHPAPAGSDYGQPKAMLDEVVSRLTEHRGDQVAGGRMNRAETKRQKQLRTQLRELHLRPISKIAKATLPDAPGIERALTMPDPQLPTTKLIDQARGMRDAVMQYEATFVAHGRPADFLAQMDAAIETLRQSVLGKARNTGRSVGAKAGLEQEIREGRRAVEMLDAIVTTGFADNKDVLAKWRNARRVKLLPGGPSATGGTEENPAPGVKEAA